MPANRNPEPAPASLMIGIVNGLFISAAIVVVLIAIVRLVRWWL